MLPSLGAGWRWGGGGSDPGESREGAGEGRTGEKRSQLSRVLEKHGEELKGSSIPRHIVQLN